MRFVTLAASAAIAVVLLVGSVASASAEPLGQKALKQLFPGHFQAIVSGMLSLKVVARRDGSLFGHYSSKSDTGRWSIRRGHLCIKWQNWLDGRSTCSPVRQDGDWYHAASVRFRKI